MYLLKTSITHHKKQIPSSNLLINWISARSGPQILTINDAYFFRFLTFLIICLCNSLANSWFRLILILTAPPANLFRLSKVSDHAHVTEVLAPEDFLLINLETFEASSRCYYDILDFQAILNALSRSNLSKAVFYVNP